MLNYSLCERLTCPVSTLGGEGQVNSDTICSIRLHRLKGSAPVTTLTLDVSLTSGVPRPPALLSNWLQIQGFPLPPQVWNSSRKTYRTQLSTTFITEVLLKRASCGKKTQLSCLGGVRICHPSGIQTCSSTRNPYWALMSSVLIRVSLLGTLYWYQCYWLHLIWPKVATL